MNPTLHWSFVAGWLLLSCFMSGMEAGVQGLSPLRIRHWVRKGRPGARTLLRYLDQPENFLWTILVGNTLANFAAAALLFADLQARLAGRPGWFWTAFVGVCAVLYLFCDLLPKTLFRRFPNRLCLLFVLPFRAVHFVLTPMVAVAEWFTHLLLKITRGSRYTGKLFGNRDEFRALMQEAGTALSSTERTLINRVLDLQNATLARVTRPIEGAVTVEVDAPVERVFELCRQHNIARLPVWQGTGKRRRIAGVVRLVDLLHSDLPPSGPVSQHLRPALFLDEGMRLDQALRRLQRGGDQFAIVVGPDGRERGLVTLWDVLGEFFGGRKG
jgi:putative hemolysin